MANWKKRCWSFHLCITFHLCIILLFGRPVFLSLWPVQSHKALHWERDRFGWMLWCHHLTVLNSIFFLRKFCFEDEVLWDMKHASDWWNHTKCVCLSLCYSILCSLSPIPTRHLWGTPKYRIPVHLQYVGTGKTREA